jgi:hypothetical protein
MLWGIQNFQKILFMGFGLKTVPQHDVCYSSVSTFEHFTDCTCCDFGHLQFINYYFKKYVYTLSEPKMSFSERFKISFASSMLNPNLAESAAEAVLPKN